jgi:hypothetical protein
MNNAYNFQQQSTNMSNIKLFSLIGTIGAKNDQDEGDLDLLVDPYIKKWVNCNIKSYNYESVEKATNIYLLSRATITENCSSPTLNYRMLNEKVATEYYEHRFLTYMEPYREIVVRYESDNLTLNGKIWKPLEYDFSLRDNEDFFAVVTNTYDLWDIIASTIYWLEPYKIKTK